MRKQALLCRAAPLLWLVACAPPLLAQPNAQQERDEAARALAEERQQAAAERQHAAAERQRAQVERAHANQVQRAQVNVERELERARDQMEAAAREVARLSAELANPVIDDFTRRFRYAGRRTMLGINIEDTELGVRVAGVSPNGPAATAGLLVGDTIVAIEGAELADSRRTGAGRQSPSELLLAQLANVAPGENVELRVLRDGDYRTMTVQAREAEPFQFFSGSPGFSFSTGPNAWIGMFRRANPWAELELVTLTPELGEYFGTNEGLLVVRTPQDDALGLMDGDVILDIGGRKPTTPEHALRILGSFEPEETLRIAIMRRQRRETLDVEIPANPPP